MSEWNKNIREPAALPLHADLQRDCEVAVRRIRMDLFGSHAAAEEGSFFQLGGDSAMAVKLVQQLAERFEITLHVVNVFQYPTVRELAGFVDQCVSQRAAASIQIDGTQEIFV